MVSLSTHINPGATTESFGLESQKGMVAVRLRFFGVGLPHPGSVRLIFCIWRFNHFHNPGLDFLHFLTCPYCICQNGFRFIQALSVLILFRKQTIMMIVNVMIDYVDS